MPIANGIYKTAIYLFRERPVLVTGPQASFDVRYWNLQVKRRKCRDHGRRRVTLDNYGIGGTAFQDFFETQQGFCREFEEALIIRHQPQVVIRHDTKFTEHLIEHLTVLSRHANAALNLGFVLKSENDRCKLDRFGACAKNC